MYILKTNGIDAFESPRIGSSDTNMITTPTLFLYTLIFSTSKQQYVL